MGEVGAVSAVPTDPNGGFLRDAEPGVTLPTG